MATKRHQIKQILKDEEFKKYIQECLVTGSNVTINSLPLEKNRHLCSAIADKNNSKTKLINTLGPTGVAILSLGGYTTGHLAIETFLNNCDSDVLTKGLMLFILLSSAFMISTAGWLTSLSIKHLKRDAESNKSLLELLEKLQAEYEQNNNPSMGS